MAIVKNFLYKTAQNNPVQDFLNALSTISKETKPEDRKKILELAEQINNLKSDELKSKLSGLKETLKTALEKIKDAPAHFKMAVMPALQRIYDHLDDQNKKKLEEVLKKVKPGFGTRIMGFVGKEGLGYGVATGTGVGLGALTGYLEARKGMPSWVGYTLPIATGAASSLLTEYLLPKEYRPERFSELFKGERFKKRWKQLAGKFAAHYLAAILTNKIMQKILRRRG
ncbi:MAG: hypothetical protein ACO2O4_05290 [Minisyncoccia bacterium]|jgi:hypothetical protein